MRPIWARKHLQQEGQRWVDAVLLVLVALALRAALFCSAWMDLWSSTVWAPLTIELRLDSMLTLKFFRETFRLPLKRFLCSRLCACPKIVYHRIAASECDRLVCEGHDQPISAEPCA